MPEPADFQAVIVNVGAKPKGDISPPTAEGFIARYDIQGIELQTGGALTSGFEERLARISAGDVDWILAKVAMGLHEGIPLFGEELIRSWQDRTAYPDVLRVREVEANLGFFQVWRVDDQLAARDAELFRRQMLLDGAFRVVAVLSAVNRLYFSTFQFKRAGAHIEQMRVKPDRMSERLDFVANGAPSEAAEELRSLIEETKAIVKAEMPGIEVERPWQPLSQG